MLRRLEADAIVRLAQGILKGLPDVVLVVGLALAEPLERFEDKGFHQSRRPGHLATCSPAAIPAHAVGDHEQESFLVPAVLQRRLRQARLLDLQGIDQAGNQELILVGRPDLAHIGQSKAACVNGTCRPGRSMVSRSCGPTTAVPDWTSNSLMALPLYDRRRMEPVSSTD